MVQRYFPGRTLDQDYHAPPSQDLRADEIPALPAADVERLATLPPRAQLVATLLGQFQAPLYRLLGVLNGPLQGFGGILQARIQQLESQETGG